MKLRRAIAAGLALLFLGTLGLAYPSEAEDHPIVLTVETAPDTELAEAVRKLAEDNKAVEDLYDV